MLLAMEGWSGSNARQGEENSGFLPELRENAAREAVRVDSSCDERRPRHTAALASSSFASSSLDAG